MSDADGRRNVLISIIENIQPAENAADMILKLFDTGSSQQPQPLRTPLLPVITDSSRFDSRRFNQGAPRGLRGRRKGTPLPDASAMKSDVWYSIDVAAEMTGYSRTNMHKILRDKPDRLLSKMDGGRRVVLGEDILKLRNERLAVTKSSQPSTRDSELDDDDGADATA